MRLAPQRRDLMLIFRTDHSADEKRGCYRVTQKVSPRVVIVEPAGGVTKEELQTVKGVDAVLEPGEKPGEDVRATLTDSEALFVEAYAQRSPNGGRLGDGLAWDADGFPPPDLPLKR